MSSARFRSRLRVFAVAAGLLALHLASAPAARAASSVFLDTPRQNAVVGPDFHLGGWAIDWAAQQTTGVMTIHVWAYPASGAPPIFLGVPSKGPRGDIAAAYGRNFLNCGYGLNVRGLNPGSYMIAIFPYSDLRHAFDYDSAIALNITVQRAAPAPAPSPTPAPTPTPGPEPETSGTSEQLRVVHWNIRHGVAQDGRYDINRYADWLAKWSPDVISLNEVERNTGWGSEDQPERFRQMLESATGKRWYAHFAQRSGDWSSRGQGNLILSRYPFASTGRETISYDRSVAIATIVVNGRNIAIMSTHLDPESNARRETQVRQVMALAAGWGEPRIIAGDFNAWPNHVSIGIMAGKYDDSWAVAAAAGVASSFSGNSPFGATKNGRIDYIWHSRGSALNVRSSRVPDTRDSSGEMPSDHRPVITVYNVR